MSQEAPPPAGEHVSAVREAGVVQIAVGAFTGALWLLLALPVGMCTEDTSASRCGRTTTWYVFTGIVALATLVTGIVMTSRARTVARRKRQALLVAAALVALTVTGVIGLLSTLQGQ